MSQKSCDHFETTDKLSDSSIGSQQNTSFPSEARKRRITESDIELPLKKTESGSSPSSECQSTSLGDCPKNEINDCTLVYSLSKNEKSDNVAMPTDESFDESVGEPIDLIDDNLAYCSNCGSNEKDMLDTNKEIVDSKVCPESIAKIEVDDDVVLDRLGVEIDQQTTKSPLQTPPFFTHRDEEMRSRDRYDDHTNTEHDAAEERTSTTDSRTSPEPSEPMLDDSVLPGIVSWRVAESVRYREYGSPLKYYSDWFRYKACGSLHFLQRLELMRKLQYHEGCVNCLNFNADGSRLASGSDDLQVCIWDWSCYDKPRLSFNSGHRENVFQAKFMPMSGDCHVITCARDGQIRLAELSVRNVCKNTRKLAQHCGSAHKLALQRDSPHLFRTCGEDGVVFEIDLRDPTPIKLLTVKEPRKDKFRMIPLYSIDTDPTNPVYFVVCGQDNFCRVFDRRCVGSQNSGQTPLKKFSPSALISNDESNVRSFHSANVTCCVYNYNGTEILASYNDDDIYLFDAKCTSDKVDDAILHTYTGHRNSATVKGVNFYGPNSEFVVTGSDCGYVYFWDKRTEQIVKFVSGDENGVVNVLEPHPTAAMLATSGLDSDVKLWAPSNESPKFDRKVLKKLLKNNANRRSMERLDVGMSSHVTEFLWTAIARMQRRAQRRRRQARNAENGDQENAEDDGGAGEDDNMDDDNDEDEDSHSDDQYHDDNDAEHSDSSEGPQVLQCRPS